jgi:CheY-like chemotaxis protein
MLLDLDLPDMRGEMVIIWVRLKGCFTAQHLPILACSATATEEILADCLKKGADSAFLKPLSREQLAKELSDYS